jgi:hypothetical protein
MRKALSLGFGGEHDPLTHRYPQPADGLTHWRLSIEAPAASGFAIANNSDKFDFTT